MFSVIYELMKVYLVVGTCTVHYRSTDIKCHNNTDIIMIKLDEFSSDAKCII